MSTAGKKVRGERDRCKSPSLPDEPQRSFNQISQVFACGDHFADDTEIFCGTIVPEISNATPKSDTFRLHFFADLLQDGVRTHLNEVCIQIPCNKPVGKHTLLSMFAKQIYGSVSTKKFEKHPVMKIVSATTDCRKSQSFAIFLPTLWIGKDIRYFFAIEHSTGNWKQSLDEHCCAVDFTWPEGVEVPIQGAMVRLQLRALADAE